MERPKVTIVGTGHVGGSAAHWLAKKDICDIVWIGRPKSEGKARGKALDLMQAGPIEGFNSKVVGTSDYADTAGSSVVTITSGVPRGPGMSRDDLLKSNAGIVEAASREVAKHSPDAVIVVVTNPLDVMTYVAWQASGFEPRKVVGQAGILDVARFKTFIAMELGCSVEDVEALLLGGHGDGMVPLPRLATVKGEPVVELIAPDRLATVVQRTRDGGAEIVKLLGTGSAYEAPGAAAALMAEAVITDSKLEVPCSAYCDGEYGVEGLFVGVPVVLGKGGVERVVEIELEPDEKATFEESVDGVRGLVEKAKQ